MKEYMLLIRNTVGSKSDFSAEQHDEFINQCSAYIGGLQQEGKLISAQPMIREGRMVSFAEGEWHEGPYNENDEVIVGYYHIRATDIGDAVNIAKGNPEFTYTKTARVEVRPLKMKEQTTGFVYPVSNSQQ